MFSYQVEAVDRIKRQPQLALFLKPGLGKTAITLTALWDMGVQRTLIVAPASVVARNVWGKEAKAWGHLSELTTVPLVGSPRDRERLLAGSATCDVISYENLPWLLGTIDIEARYGAIVFDELSRLKHPGTSRYRKLRSGSMDIPIRIGLTGSPVGNHLLDIWAEMFMVAGDKPLGRTYTGFRRQYFCPTGYDPRFSNWDLKHPSYEAEIHERVKPYAFSLDPALAADKLPPVRASTVRVSLPASALEIESDLGAKCVAQLASGASLEVMGASAAAGKLRQIASGAVYIGDGSHTWEHVHGAKVDALVDLVEEQQGEPMLVFYHYQHELSRLLKALPTARAASAPGVLDAWDRGEIEVMLAHPQSVGHGLNLQSSGSTVVWFALPYSHELYEQGIGRLARPGQKAAWVTSVAILAGDFDESIYSLLETKRGVQDRLTQAVRLSRIEDDPMFS